MRIFERLTAFILFILLLPLFTILFLLVTFDSKGIFLFNQLRSGKNKRPFLIHKIRTMYVGAHFNQHKYLRFNEADGPVFKIRNDPRFTNIGKFLANTGLDELPQLLNVLKGDMSFVGPRPLPINETNKIPSKFNTRFSVLPGITSSWVINGSHSISFVQWMKLDLEYVEKNDLLADLGIAFHTVGIILRNLFREKNI